MTRNPFPGPTPYRASDRERFYGREELSRRLSGSILAKACVTVYGPSGAGKSSLMQASVLPDLIDAQDARMVRVDSWPEGQDPTGWLASAMYSDLRLGELSSTLSHSEGVLAAAKRSARASSRLIIIYLDQLEQLLYPGRTAEETDPFFACLQALVELPLSTVRIVLSLRESYLGRLRDRMRDCPRALAHSFRVGPLTVAELTDAVCQIAASGEPPQTWAIEPTAALMVQVRVPGQAATPEAEAQTAYAQVVCRALFHQRAQGTDAEGDETEAESILRQYLETTLSDLGPLRDAAEQLLEDNLVTADGSRTLRTEQELLRLVPPAELHPILRALEGAAILHAEEHQGSRYFEIGHDWLARRVFELRQQRDARQEIEARLKKARAQRRTLAIIAGASLAFAAVAGSLGLFALRERARAEQQAVRAESKQQEAEKSAARARNASRMSVAHAHLDNPTTVLALLREIEPGPVPQGWSELARWARDAGVARVVTSHDKGVWAAAWSPDGKRIVSGSEDKTVRIWNADGTGEPLVLRGHDDAVYGVAWSPDGRRVASVSGDKTVRVWNADGTGEPLILRGHDHGIRTVAWSPDSRRVVSAAWDKTVQVWNADGTGQPLVLRGHEDVVFAAAYSPDGRHIVSAAYDKTVRVWNADGTGQPLVLRGHGHAVLAAAYSPDGRHIVSASWDQTVRVWNADGTGEPLVLRGHDQAVFGASYSPDGRRVVSASWDKTVRVWNADGTGQPLVLYGHDDIVWGAAVSPDGRRIVSVSLDKTARVWNTEDTIQPLVLRGHEQAATAAALSPDGLRIASASLDKTVRVWNADGTGQPLVLRGHEGAVNSAVFSPDGHHIASASLDKTVRVWNTDRNGEPRVLRGHDEQVNSAAYSPDGRRIVSASEDKTGRVWNADGTGEPIVLRGHDLGLTTAAFSPDGRRIVSASYDRTVRVWNADGSGEPLVLRGHEGSVTGAAVSPDGRRIVSGSWDKTLRVWNADGTGEPKVLRGHVGMAFVDFAGAFSPDGKSIVSGSFDRTVRIWDDRTDEPIVLLAGRFGVHLASFSPDGKRILGASEDNAIMVWSHWARLRDADDPSLWTATTYCMPIEVRRQLLDFTEEQARADLSRCQRHVREAEGRGAKPGG